MFPWCCTKEAKGQQRSVYLKNIDLVKENAQGLGPWALCVFQDTDQVPCAAAGPGFTDVGARDQPGQGDERSLGLLGC